MADPVKNFAYSTVSTAPSPATSGTTLVPVSVSAFPDPDVDGPFNAVVWPAGAPALSSNAEIIRVTSETTGTFTIVRQQESTSARTIVVGDQIMLGPTAKTISDLNVVRMATVELAAGDINALPHTLVAGVAGYAILPIHVTVQYNFVTTPFTGTYGIEHATGTELSSTSYGMGGADKFTIIAFLWDEYTVADVDGDDLVISGTLAAGDGNALVTVLYSMIDLL